MFYGPHVGSRTTIRDPYQIDKWDVRFLSIAVHIMSWSKDPIRKVGCAIFDDDKNQLSGGFNGFARGVADLEDRLQDKNTKNDFVVHAEANAVATAARNGHSLKGATAYITQLPCSQCAALLIQAGIKRVVAMRQPGCSEATVTNHKLAGGMLQEAGVIFIEVPDKTEEVFGGVANSL